MHIHMSDADADLAALDSKLLGRLMRYITPYKGQIVVSLIMMALVSAAGLAGPMLIQIAIDNYIGSGNLGGLNLIAVAFLAINIVNWICTYWETYIMSWVGQKAIYSIREDLFSHLQRLTFSYYDKVPAGVVMSRVTNDVEALNELIANGIVHTLNDVLTLLIIVVMMLRYDWRLALATFTTVPCLAICSVYFRKFVLDAYRDVRRKIADVYANLQESISGVRVTQSFSREGKNLERFDRHNMENMQANLRAVTVFSIFAPIIAVIGSIGTCIVLWYGGARVLGGEITIGVLTAFLAYSARFFQPIQDLTSVYNQLQAATAACEKIFGIMDTPPEVDNHEGATELANVQGSVEFRGVTFGYDPKSPILHDINLVARPGQRIALVGPTGAGKSSIINLLCRFYDPQDGAILVDGQDIREVTLKSLRDQLGIVLQDTFLFSGTVRDNIRYGRLTATDEEIEQAARTVNAHEFIERMDHGYDTQVEERGAKLSIGQRQLIAFARALLRDPRILILDEATSSVDAYTEVLIQRALDRLLEGRTSFIIAHRLSTIRDADCIMVIADGSIVEAGTHQELLAKNGVYHTLYEMQFKFQEQAGDQALDAEPRPATD